MTPQPEAIPDGVGDGRPDPLRIAPSRYVLEADALADLDRYVGSLTHAPSVEVIAGETGFDAVRDDLDRALRRLEADVEHATFSGECAPETIATHRERVAARDPDVLIAVGGGKAIDTAKLAAEGICPVVAVPTSAATCAAWSALSICYESDGTYRGGVPLSRCPEAVVADLEVIADAPARLLANGVMDASAKYFLTRMLAGGSRPTVGWAGGVADGTHLDVLRSDGAAAYADAKASRVTSELTRVVEAAIAGPGLVGGLLSDRSYLTLPHLFCYSSLDHGSVQEESLHGERVAYGVVALQVLLGDAAAADPRELLDWYGSLGADLTLRGLGVDDVDDAVDRIARDVADGLTYQFVPAETSHEDVADAIRRVETLSNG
ncbi:iron-containing alcohol dehydrogenase [Halorubrum sp. JWXQ-INN 858]|uniref:iron-containing alcohol dehydrogenase n=1 Tax=Halorubrum sp. JWXQ-INN 858 TaxID=2690782 RepID=UPI0013577B47|nr:iron-containing alcohol dehydrogenase [Halorubrum sp. JWXQ-INN 858]MWV64852.1 iron-containing alcohol dehydrogenase [Halorubrum sp. JWXQ-INN 858]